MKKILLFSFVLLTALVSESWAQERTISGKVTSVEDGTTLPGVNVVLKGTTNGTITDVDGNFKLSVPSEGGTLTFSFIGLATEEIEIGARSVIDLAMSADVKQLSEVVVSALGVERETKALGYSVQSVSGEGMTEARETNIVNSLSGRIAGVQITNASGSVGASSRIILRGASSITGNNQPLFVVNGIPISNASDGSNAGPFGGADFGGDAGNSLNPDDIESVTVLKGAPAAALYGSRASNGVILVTTKSGKGSQGLGVSVNSTTTFQRPSRLPDWQNSYGQGASNKSFRWIDGSNGDGGVDESWGPPLDIGLEFPQFTSDGTANEPWISHPDNVNDFFETGVTSSNSIALSGGNDLGSFRLGYTHVDQSGTLPNTDLKRQTFSLGSNYNLSEKLSAEFNLTYVIRNSDNVPTPGYTGQNVLQQFIWSGRQVDFQALRDYENLPLASAGQGAGIAPLNWNTRFQDNPYWQSDNLINGVKSDRVYGNARINYKFNDWLSLFVRTGVDYNNTVVNQHQAVGTTNSNNGDFRNRVVTRKETNTDFLLTFNKSLNDDLRLSVSVGANQMRQEVNNVFVRAPELELPGVYNVSNTKSGVTPILTNNFTQKRINSVLATSQIGFREFLYLDLSVRNDWSSTLPDGENSYLYYSGTLSAVVTDILDIQSDVLSFLKVRGGFGQVGSDTQAYNLQQAFAFRSPWGAVIQPAEGNSLLNPDLKPEITTEVEFGLDARFWNGKLNLDVTYYDKTTKDQIIPVQITGASGYTSRNTNIGEMANKGIEIQLSGTPVKVGDFSWETGVNFAKNTNEVIELAPGLDELRITGQWNVSVQARPGQPYGALFGPGFQKDPDGNVIHQNGLPLTDPTFRVLGNITPDWTGGWFNTFSYKGVSLNVLVDAKMGGDIYSMTTTWGRFAGVLEETLQGREDGIVGVGVMDDGDGNFVPNDVVVRAKDYNQSGYSNSIAESSVFDASFVKLRQVQIGYTLPQSLLGNLPFKDVKVSVVGRNLALLYSNVPHIDPETAFGSGNGRDGIEFGQDPSARSIGFNIGFKF